MERLVERAIALNPRVSTVCLRWLWRLGWRGAGIGGLGEMGEIGDNFFVGRHAVFSTLTEHDVLAQLTAEYKSQDAKIYL